MRLTFQYSAELGANKCGEVDERERDGQVSFYAEGLGTSWRTAQIAPGINFALQLAELIQPLEHENTEATGYALTFNSANSYL